LLDAARDAFTAGLQVTAITGAALLAVLAGLVAVLVRHEAPTDAGAELEPAAASVTTG
jgi:hypothetical protein